MIWAHGIAIGNKIYLNVPESIASPHSHARAPIKPALLLYTKSSCIKISYILTFFLSNVAVRMDDINPGDNTAPPTKLGIEDSKLTFYIAAFKSSIDTLYNFFQKMGIIAYSKKWSQNNVQMNGGFRLKNAI